MIGGVQHDDVAAPRVGAGQAQRELVRLAARADEVADAQRLRQGRAQALGVARQRVVQVAGVGVEDRHLALAGAHDARVGVADMRHVVDAVEIGPPVHIEELLAVAADDLERAAIRDTQVWAEPLPPNREQLLHAALVIGSR